MALEGHCGGDNVEDQNSSLLSEKESQPRSAKPVDESLVSLEKSGKRKRGRPVGRGSKMVKTAGNQTHRSRTRIGKRPAKIFEYATDESGSHDEKPCEGDIDSRDFSLDSRNGAEVIETVILQNPEPPSKGDDAVKQEVLKEIEREEHSVPEIEMAEQHNDLNTRAEQHELWLIRYRRCFLASSLALRQRKLRKQRMMVLKMTSQQKMVVLKIISHQRMIMLNTMLAIRMLGHLYKDVKYNDNVNKPPVQYNAGPSRKKKVSYKDVANELLKDW